MFEYIRGTLVQKTPTYAVVDVNGIGYLLDIPASTFDALPAQGQKATVYAHLHVREDVQRLYGFATVAEREAFRQLIAISQIGPRVAVAVLSSISVADLGYAVAMQDPSRFKSVSGIGPKTAQRLVMELKGKLQVPEGGTAAGPKESVRTASASVGGKPRRLDAHEAMLSLGYTEAQVVKSLARVEQVLEPDAPVEEWIRTALQVI
jgi:Holliday junction DNA helicase RuvA